MNVFSDNWPEVEAEDAFPAKSKIESFTGKSLSEALIFASTKPQYEDRLDYSLNYKFKTWKFKAQTLGEHVVYRNCFWHSKRRASDKDLPV